MKEKLKSYMDYLGLTAAQLADQIGVQRSSFSHILNGRNKPSADFINKLLNANPDLNANWLFGSSDKMLISQRLKSGMRDLFSEDNQNKQIQKSTPKIESVPEKHESLINATEKSIIQPEIKQDKQIEKIVILFNDNSFKEYIPE
jgi:transcriptional regulator with XRE-family HTH domain